MRIEGMDEVMALIERMGSAEQAEVASNLIRQLAYWLRAQLAPYPPDGRWNRPGGPGSRWYERHYGQRWMRRDGSIGGRQTSQRMQQRWDLTFTDGGAEARLTNGASYAPYVVGHRQRGYHRRHGWVSVDRRIREMAQKFLPGALRRFLYGLLEVR